QVRDPTPPWQHVAIVGWAGMRGVVSLAAAFALPLALPTGQPFPGRDYILFVAFSVILVTLVLQGLTLPVLIRKLGVPPAAESAVHSSLSRSLTIDTNGYGSSGNRSSEMQSNQKKRSMLSASRSQKTVAVKNRIAPANLWLPLRTAPHTSLALS